MSRLLTSASLSSSLLLSFFLSFCRSRSRHHHPRGENQIGQNTALHLAHPHTASLGPTPSHDTFPIQHPYPGLALSHCSYPVVAPPSSRKRPLRRSSGQPQAPTARTQSLPPALQAYSLPHAAARCSASCSCPCQSLRLRLSPCPGPATLNKQHPASLWLSCSSSSRFPVRADNPPMYPLRTLLLAPRRRR